jgi:hypothetical protein
MEWPKPGQMAEARAGLSGVVADREAEWWEAGSRGLTSGLPAGRNSAWFRRQPLDCPTSTS